MDEQEFEHLAQEDVENQGEVDLNRVFKKLDLDLNAMFPDGEMRKFLQQIKKNRCGNERFLKGMKKEKLFGEDE